MGSSRAIEISRGPAKPKPIPPKPKLEPEAVGKLGSAAPTATRRVSPFATSTSTPRLSPCTAAPRTATSSASQSTWIRLIAERTTPVSQSPP